MTAELGPSRLAVFGQFVASGLIDQAEASDRQASRAADRKQRDASARTKRQLSAYHARLLARAEGLAEIEQEISVLISTRAELKERPSNLTVAELAAQNEALEALLNRVRAEQKDVRADLEQILNELRPKIEKLETEARQLTRGLAQSKRGRPAGAGWRQAVVAQLVRTIGTSPKLTQRLLAALEVAAAPLADVLNGAGRTIDSFARPLASDVSFVRAWEYARRNARKDQGAGVDLQNSPIAPEMAEILVRAGVPSNVIEGEWAALNRYEKRLSAEQLASFFRRLVASATETVAKTPEQRRLIEKFSQTLWGKIEAMMEPKKMRGSRKKW